MAQRSDIALAGEPEIDPATEPTDPFRFRSLGNNLPRLVVFAVLLNALIMVLSIFVWPPNRSPDENIHADLIAAVARGQAVPWPAPAKLHETYGGEFAGVVDPARCRCEPLPAKDAPPAWPSWNDVGGDKATVHINWMVQHPPLYYSFMAAALKAFPNWRNHPYNVVLDYLKLINLIFVLPLPLFAWAAARRLTRNRVVAATAAVGTMLVPHVQHLGSSLNNDNLLLFEAGLLTVLLAYVIRGDTSRRTGIIIGITLAAALLTKGTALVFLPWVLLAYLVAWRRTGSWGRAGFHRTVVPAAISLIGAGVFGGWWWIHNKIAYGVVQVNGDISDQHSIARKPSVTTFSDTGLQFLNKFFKNMMNTFWFDTTQRPVPNDIAQASVVVTVLVGSVVLLGVVRAFVARLPRPPGERLDLYRFDAVFLLTIPVMILGVLIVGAWPAWRTALGSNGQQGRYLYPGLVGLLVLFAVGIGVLARRWSVLVTAVLVGITQAMMGVALVWTYWLPRGRPVSFGLFADAAHAAVAWSALNAPALAVLLALTLAAYVAVVWEAARFRGDDPPADESPAVAVTSQWEPTVSISG